MAKLLGVALALFAGALAGVQSAPWTKLLVGLRSELPKLHVVAKVPAAIYNQRHPNARPTVVVFPQCLGRLGQKQFWRVFSCTSLRSATRGPGSTILVIGTHPKGYP